MVPWLPTYVHMQYPSDFNTMYSIIKSQIESKQFHTPFNSVCHRTQLTVSCVRLDNLKSYIVTYTVYTIGHDLRSYTVI